MLPFTAKCFQVDIMSFTGRCIMSHMGASGMGVPEGGNGILCEQYDSSLTPNFFRFGEKIFLLSGGNF